MSDIRVVLRNLPKWLLFIIGAFLVIIVGYLDYLTGEYSLLVFYLVPLALVTWYVGCFEGILVAILSGFSRYLTENVFIHSSSLLYWNSMEDLFILVFAAVLIHLLRISLQL